MSESRNIPPVRQEHLEISTRAVLASAVVLIVASLACVGLMRLILSARWGRVANVISPPASGLVTAPLLRSNILETARGQQLQQTERQRLEEWGWVEKGKVARIPISEASRWLVQEGKQGSHEP